MEARRRLVEADELRAGGHRPCDLEAALVAVRQVRRQLVGLLVDAHEAEQLHGALVALLLLAPVARKPEERAEHGGAVPRVRPDQPVLERGAGGEAADVLERPGEGTPGWL